MRNVKAVVLALLTALALRCIESRADAREKQRPSRARTTLLFVDVTSSLTQLQIDQVIETSGTIIQGMRGGTDLLVYAIQSDPHAPPFAEHHFIRPTNRAETYRAQAGMMRLQNEVSEDIFDLYCSINWNDERTKKACRNRQILPRPQSDLRSCILGTLTHVFRKVEDLKRAGKGPVDVIYVSDMIEECERNPLGRMIKLTHRDLRSDISEIPKFRGLPDLGRTRLTVIVPRGIEQQNPNMPDFDDLRSYWGEIFSRSNADWRFESEVPASLKPQKGR
jgi:hypothetical protein